MKTLHKTLFLAAVLGLSLVFAPAPPLQAGERIIIGSQLFGPGLIYRVDSPYPRHRYVVPGHSYVYGPSYYYGNYRRSSPVAGTYFYGDRYRDDGPRFYRDRYYDGPRSYRDRDRYYDGRRYYRERDRDRYYGSDNDRRYRVERYTPQAREERFRRDTYKEQRIPKEQKTMQERRWSR
ncbi:MAG: hypothetical protein Q4G66_06865 [bacterium]|nr:hypothetical protein [bacterium]